MSYATPKRLQAYFPTRESGEKFARLKEKSGATDVQVSSTAVPDGSGVNVIWTEYTED